MGEKDAGRIPTAEVFTELIASGSFGAFYAENAEQFQPPELTQYLAELCESKGVQYNDLFQATDIDRGFGYHIFAGRRRLSRDNALKLALGLGMDVEETQRLLLVSKNSQLYPRVPRDAAILYCIHHKQSYRETQDNLYDWGMTVLGEEVKYEKLGR